MPDIFPNHHQSPNDTFALSFVGIDPRLAQAAANKDGKSMQSIAP